MINLEEHIVKIDGTEYVPFKIAQAVIAETYVDKVNEINKVLNSALDKYDKGIKDILDND